MREPGRVDLVAQLLEARHVDRDVVVDEEDAPHAAPVERAQVLDHAPDREAAEGPPVHPPDRAEGAGQRAAAGGLGDVEGTVEVEGAVPGARLAARQRHRVELEQGAVLVVTVARRAPPRETGNRREVERPARQPVDELPEGELTLAADDEVEEMAVARAHLVGEDGGVVAPEEVKHAGRDAADGRGERPRRVVLE